MIEYTDGRFGSIAPAKDILELLQKMPTLDDVKAVHLGTQHELQNIRDNKLNVDSIRNELDELKREMATLKPKSPIKIYDLEDIPK